MESFRDQYATHYVSSVVYGGNVAFNFVFKNIDREIAESEVNAFLIGLDIGEEDSLPSSLSHVECFCNEEVQGLIPEKWTIESLKQFLQELPKAIEESNDYDCAPIYYRIVRNENYTFLYNNFHLL